MLIHSNHGGHSLTPYSVTLTTVADTTSRITTPLVGFINDFYLNTSVFLSLCVIIMSVNVHFVHIYHRVNPR